MTRRTRLRVLPALILPAALVFAAAPAARADVRVSVPPAVIGSMAAVDGGLAVGSDSDVTTPVWLAAGQPRAVARVTAVGGHTRCAPRTLRAGAVTRLTCRVRVASGSTRVTVQVVVRSSDGVLARRAVVIRVRNARA